MKNRFVLLAVVVAQLLIGTAARADYIYSFSSLTSAPGFGPLSGSFTVSDAAISDGTIVFSEFTTYSFADSIFTFAPSAPSVSASILVNSSTGALLNTGGINLLQSDFDAPAGVEVLSLPTGPGTMIYFRIGDAPNIVGSGTGTWTVRHAAIPEPGSLAFGTAFCLGLFLVRRRA